MTYQDAEFPSDVFGEVTASRSKPNREHHPSILYLSPPMTYHHDAVHQVPVFVIQGLMGKTSAKTLVKAAEKARDGKAITNARLDSTDGEPAYEVGGC